MEGEALALPEVGGSTVSLLSASQVGAVSAAHRAAAPDPPNNAAQKPAPMPLAGVPTANAGGAAQTKTSQEAEVQGTMPR